MRGGGPHGRGEAGRPGVCVKWFACGVLRANSVVA